MSVVFKKTQGLTEAQTHYCPGCTHGIIHRLVGEVLRRIRCIRRYCRCCSSWMFSFSI